jgi:uracil-DNA glycosylase family 4
LQGPLDRLNARIVRCVACPRLVAHREAAAAAAPRRYSGQRYWARPLPAFGDPRARLLLVGLAPAAHGGNRTGRMFTGDRSGDWLFDALHHAGFANQPTSRHRDDGLRLRDAYITATIRCAPPANKPTPAERDACLPWTVAELGHLPALRVVVCLGAFAWDAALRLRVAAGHPAPRPRPRFGHEAVFDDGAWLAMLGCFHPSQQNTFTGRLTEPMIDAVFERARALAVTRR